MSDEVKNAPHLRVGLINEILSAVIFIRMDQLLEILPLDHSSAPVSRCYTSVEHPIYLKSRGAAFH
jgi:hypothetical protein